MEKKNIYVIIGLFFLSRQLFGLKIQQIIDPFSIMLPQMDFLKDMVLVVRLITLLGGIVVFTNPLLFSSNVSRQSYMTQFSNFFLFHK